MSTLATHYEDVKQQEQKEAQGASAGQNISDLNEQTYYGPHFHFRFHFYHQSLRFNTCSKFFGAGRMCSTVDT